MTLSRILRNPLTLAGLAAASLFVSSSAEARGFLSFGVTAPLAPAYYGPPPAYYYPPPPVAYAPPPATYYAPPPAYNYQAPSASYGGRCEPYESTTTIYGRPETVTGTACLQPDGTWRIVR